jgi:hypothetical protein
LLAASIASYVRFVSACSKATSCSAIAGNEVIGL